MDYIFDIDDTLSNSTQRDHYIRAPNKNWDTYYSLLIEDEPIASSVAILQSLYAQGHRIILCTGRPEEYRDLTVQWLERYNIPAHDLYMRQPKEAYLRNAEVKRILLACICQDGYVPKAVFEDNPNSVEMWREAGLQVFQVAPKKSSISVGT
jgi:beta-phosphoglucomutase-like phosphatase (HAD superfamily)